MNKIGIGVLALLLTQAMQGKAQKLTSSTDSVSYALGMDVGSSLTASGVVIHPESFLKGVQDGVAGSSRLIEKEEGIRIIKAAFAQAAEMKAKALKQEETTFFDGIKTKPGVKAGEAGLYYEVLQEGTGAKPTATDEVTVHYKGALASGKVFDSSYDRGEPIDLGLDRVIRGWQIGIPLMTVGSKYRLYIPSDLGYGERGAGADIPPYSALVFEIELIGIKDNNAVN
ncbi:FKBP-type peptidyl-prolyl cis-trans isomerase [Sphingobacterium oryzagri]|uniref:Peptidyl-prolyl cis-trans isomerase n=1 Tax=Sphingobacterium oryzagri TaxID=3025669 RepID=A0ABY7WFP2_9SPHI|nr:FKBP-type peptidyl-prolyl cis-trans isomerase [Sphingobacterium sp. KACC 22765]WDF67346.1 FKBP-type peptidyl-prolyl cis-trans isomerase [Sphingobacterium sp. KACC 22765]